VLRILSTLIIPVIILVLAIFLYPEARRLVAGQLLILKWLPIGIAIIALVLSLRFNRSRMFFSVLTVISTYVILQWYWAGIGKADMNVIWSALCVFLPMNFLIYSLLQERGTFTLWGSTRFGLLLLPFVVIIGLSQAYPAEIENLLRANLVEKDLSGGFNFTQISLVMILVTLIVLNGRMFARPAVQNGSLFVAVLASLGMLHFKESTSANAIFASAAVLMLAIAVIQESWSMAYIDQLTRLPGRRALDEEMLKLGGNFSIAMVDIDHFKKFNDRHGHDAGDQVLRMVATRIRQAVSGGKAFRYGGEEFTLVFSGKDIEDTIDGLDDVRKSVCDSKFQLRSRDRRRDKNSKDKNNKNVKVSISIGVANRSERSSSANEVIKAADKALYRAKKQGRNRVCK